MIRVAPIRLCVAVRLLRAGSPVSFSRWGDGEWQCVLGHAGQNCDGHPYTSALRRDLSRVLEAQPAYWLGMQPFAMRSLGPAIVAWLERRGLRFHWLDADIFHRASIEQVLDPFLQALRARPLILVGPPYLQGLAILPHATLVPLPEQNCYTAYADVLARTRAAVAAAPPTVCVALSAGPMANVLIHDLTATFPRRTFLDVGSLWDPYAGKVTRKYHKRVIASLCA